MSETIAEKKTRLETLKAKEKDAREKRVKEQKRLETKARREKTADNAKIRKERDAIKYAFGGLCEIAGLLEKDRGAVLGVLLWAAKKFDDDPASLANFKAKGDPILKQREAERLAAKALKAAKAEEVAEELEAAKSAPVEAGVVPEQAEVEEEELDDLVGLV